MQISMSMCIWARWDACFFFNRQSTTRLLVACGAEIGLHISAYWPLAVDDERREMLNTHGVIASYKNNIHKNKRKEVVGRSSAKMVLALARCVGSPRVHQERSKLSYIYIGSRFHSMSKRRLSSADMSRTPSSSVLSSLLSRGDSGFIPFSFMLVYMSQLLLS